MWHQSQAAPATGCPTSAACDCQGSRPRARCGGTRPEAATASSSSSSKAPTALARSPTCASCRWTPVCYCTTTAILSAPFNSTSTTRPHHRHHSQARTNDTCLWLVRSLLLITAQPTLTVSCKWYRTALHPCRFTRAARTRPCPWDLCPSLLACLSGIRLRTFLRVRCAGLQNTLLIPIYKFCYCCNGTKRMAIVLASALKWKFSKLKVLWGSEQTEPGSWLSHNWI
jgi:hypothetical protein